MKLRRILVPVDGSELSERALPWARALARCDGASLTLLRAVPSPAAVIARYSAASPGAYMDPIAVDPMRDVDAMKRAGAEDLERLRSEIADVPVTVMLEEGSAAEVIVAHAAADPADLIVMSTRGEGGLTRALLGSVADAVVRSAPCPVLLVPARAE